MQRAIGICLILGFCFLGQWAARNGNTASAVMCIVGGVIAMRLPAGERDRL
jgi:hypothetical protein